MSKAKKIFICFIEIMIPVNPAKNYFPMSFGMYLNTVEDKNGRLKYRTDTAIFRNDLDFNKMVKFLDKKYSNTQKVNIIAHACSDGEEIFSVLSILKSQLGERYKKFTPVIAKDIDSEAIERAKKGVCYFTYDEFTNAEHYLKDNLFDYFDKYRQYNERVYKKRTREQYYFGINYKVCDEILKDIKFEKGNIIQDARKLDFKNTVLFARNFWPYLSNGQIEYLAKTLASRMDNSSTLIIGDYDREYGIHKLLVQNGFVETEVKNIFEKPKNTNDKLRNTYNYKQHRIYD